MHKTQKLLNLLLSKPVVTLPEIMKLKIASHTKAISNLRQAGYLITNKKYWPRVGKSEYVLNWWCYDDIHMDKNELLRIRKNNWTEDFYNRQEQEEKKKDNYFEWKVWDLKINWIPVDMKRKDTLDKDMNVPSKTKQNSQWLFNQIIKRFKSL